MTISHLSVTWYSKCCQNHKSESLFDNSPTGLEEKGPQPCLWKDSKGCKMTTPINSKKISSLKTLTQLAAQKRFPEERKTIGPIPLQYEETHNTDYCMMLRLLPYKEHFTSYFSTWSMAGLNQKTLIFLNSKSAILHVVQNWQDEEDYPN